MQKNAKRKPQEAKRHRTNRVAWELPGQVATQALFWTFCPSQDVPPFSGVGLVQLRLLFCQPRPHTALQDDQVVHVDQPPLTVRPAPVGMEGGRRGREEGRDGWRDRAARITRHALRKKEVCCARIIETAVTLFGSALQSELMEEQRRAAACVRVGVAANCSENKMASTGSRK